MAKTKPALDQAFDFSPIKFDPIKVIPKALTGYLLLTLRSAASHHDPATQDDSNKNLFNRRKQILPQSSLPTLPSQTEIDSFCAANPVPEESALVLQTLSFAEFVACGAVKLFIDCYNSADGSGIFVGMERYSRLEQRLSHAAAQAKTMRGLWDGLSRGLQVGIHDSKADGKLLALWALPRSIQSIAIEAMKRDYRSVVTLARHWHTQGKMQNEAYAEKARLSQNNTTELVSVADVRRRQERADSAGAMIRLTFSAADLSEPTSAAVIEVPEVSANSLRHQLVRNPGWVHLRRSLGFQATEPGKGELPPSVQAIFENGGNIEAGAKQPSDTYGKARLIRQAFPLLDLLGGVADSFDLGKSKLDVHTWLVCKENLDALAGTPAADLPVARLSAFEMLDDVTETRQATEAGLGQMIRGFEAAIKGCQILVRLDLRADTRTLTQGALIAAISTFEEASKIAGQSSRGFGLVRPEWLSPIPEAAESAAEYEAYLETNRDSLRAEMTAGSLGCGSAVLT